MMTPRPFTLIAELTYRCPLHCPYCSNPPGDRTRDELPAELLERVLGDAEALGVVQVHLTGGEPLLYRELPRLVARARSLELYTNLITSGVPLTRERLAALRVGWSSRMRSTSASRSATATSSCRRAISSSARTRSRSPHASGSPARWR